MKQWILFFTCCLIFSNLFAQREAAIWYFGQNGGLDFNSGSPVAIGNSAMSTNEGCATISDAYGNLLFYTNGENVYDRNHNLMPNGTGLLGSFNSTQSSIIVPKPQDPDIYYIFTTDFQANANGLRYSEVDMSLNGGDGDVTVKNTLLLTPVSEKLSVIPHSNKTDYWLISHEWDTDAFYVYEVTNAGVSSVPVISNVGSVHEGLLGGGISNSLGYMKPSLDGTRLALVMFSNGQVELFDFDASTGVLSNAIVLANWSAYAPNKLYGVEFSPNGELLYVSAQNLGFYQFDITSGIADTIISTITELFIGGQVLCLQLGVDQKIYVARGGPSYLGVVNDPNVPGLGCNFVEQGLNLVPGTFCNLGLPSFVQHFINFRINFDVVDFCTTYPTQFILNANQDPDSIFWYFGDPASGANDSSMLLAPTHTYTAPGIYTATVIAWAHGFSDTAYQTFEIFPPPTVDVGPDTALCDNGTLSITLDATVTGHNLSYNWFNSGQNPTIQVSFPGWYWLDLTNECGTVRDSLWIEPRYIPTVDLGVDTILCEGTSIFLDATGQNQSYLWSDQSNNATFLLTEPGITWVSVTNKCGTVRDSIVVDARYFPVVDLGPDTILCEGDVFELDVQFPNASYEWQDQNTQPAYLVSSGGIYSVTVNTVCGVASDEKLVEDLVAPFPFSLGADTTICEGVLISKGEEQGHVSYLWENGFEGPFREVAPGGLYWLQLFNQCGLEQDSILIHESLGPTLNLGGDQVKCLENTFLLEAEYSSQHSFPSFQWNHGGDQPFTRVREAGIYGLTIENDCGTAYEEVEITENFCECRVYMPNAFSPNNDGINETFGARASCDLAYFELQIFDRWGRQVFASQSPDQHWEGQINGRPAVEGVYVWKLVYKGIIQGDPLRFEEIRQGTLTLLR